MPFADLYTMVWARIYDNVRTVKSRRKSARNLSSQRSPLCRVVEHFAQPFAVQRLDQKAIHAGGETGLAVLGLRIGGERDDAGGLALGFGFGGANTAGG